MPTDHVYKLEQLSPSLVLTHGFSGSHSYSETPDTRIYGRYTIQAFRSVQGLISHGLECVNGRNGERVERPQYPAPHVRVFPQDMLFAYRIDIDGLEYIEVTPHLGYSYPTLNHAMHYANGEDIRQLNFQSPLMSSFRGQPEPHRDMRREAKVYLQANRHVLRRARYTEEVVVRGPIAPERIELYQVLPAQPIGQRVRPRT